MSTQSVLFDAPGPKARRRVLVINIVGVLLVLALAAWLLNVLGDAGQLQAEKWAVFAEGSIWNAYVLPGLINTIKAAVVAIVTAMIFGFLFGIGRLSNNRVVNGISSVVVEFFRAVPVLLMMIFFWIFLARAAIVPPADAPFVAVVVALTLYNGSVIAELIRSGVHGLPKGQREAATAIGLTRGQSLRAIEIPQALTAMLPALISQFVVILKDSALGYIINYNELLFNARLIGNGNANVLQALVVAAAIFIVINFALTRVAETLASRLSSRRHLKVNREAAQLVGKDAAEPVDETHNDGGARR